MNNHIRYTKWINRPYYVTKAIFIQRGFSLVKSECEIHEKEGYGLAVFDSGTSKLIIKTTLFRNQNTGNLNCGKIIDINEYIYD